MVTITDRGGYNLCDTEDTFSTAYSMIYSGNAYGWAQSGNIRRPGSSCVRRWAEQSQNGTSWGDYYISGCTSPGGVNRYWQQSVLVNGAWRMRSNIDVTVIKQSSWNQFSNWTTPFQAEFMSETYYRQTDVPGRLSAKERYDDLQAQSYSDDNWHGACGYMNLGSANGNAPAWGVDAVDCNTIRTWTD